MDQKKTEISLSDDPVKNQIKQVTICNFTSIINTHHTLNYYQFFVANKKILLFGILLVFFSSFGQTFIISLFIPWFIQDFDISRSFFSGIYALATLLSASILIYAGKKIDYVPLKGFTLFVIFGMLAACIVTALSRNVVLLFISLFLLRFFGQGLLSHTAMTTMGRFFSKARGKALSIAYLGFPLGEALLPVLVVSIIGLIGWRESFGMIGLFILIVLFPLAIYLLGRPDAIATIETAANIPIAGKGDKTNEEPLWKQADVLRSRAFYLYAPSVFLIGFLQTALFFFQTFIADEKMWRIEWMAASIMAYAVASSLSSIAAGPMVDRYTAARIFPFVLIPLAMGLLVLSYGVSHAFAPVFWFFIGISGGMSSPVNASLYAEKYGARSLGTVRSLFTFVMVVSTAMGPLVYSFFLERSFSFRDIHWLMIAVITVNLLFILVARKRMH